ncbi:SET-domain-containing protein [Mycena kentingensis (nom. inval.)]|nr:SET-domain-containing protein [Mycena kentingensis (nom. inval.)]
MSTHDPFLDPASQSEAESSSEAEDQEDEDSVELRNQALKIQNAIKMRTIVEQEFRQWKMEKRINPARERIRQRYPGPPIPNKETSAAWQTTPKFLITTEGLREDAVIHYDCDPDGVQQHIWAVFSVEDYPSVKFTMHPEYRYCVPAPANMLAPSEDSLAAPWMPFPDAPYYPDQSELEDADEDNSSFPYGKYVQRFPLGASRHGFPPPALLHTEMRTVLVEELITYETIRRLYNQGYTEADLDFVLESEVAKLGGVPLWAWIDGEGRSYEISHDYVWFSQPITVRKPTLTNKELVQQKRRGKDVEVEPCSDYCFIDFLDMSDDEMDVDEDTTPEIKFAIGLLDLEPDMSPCHFAVIARIECRVAYKLRCARIANNGVKKRNKPKKGKSMNLRTMTEEAERKRRGYTHPCSHLGACTKAQRCQCSRHNAHCERNCGCDPACARRWRGCNVTCASRKRCSPLGKHGEPCACKVAYRECDPELCTGCRARSAASPNVHGRGFCDNMQLQRGADKAVIVRKSQYGLGAYAGQRFKKDELIGEYTGELVENDADSSPRAVIHDYGIPSYLYALGRASIDARLLGNPTRFFNDSMPADPNCGPHHKLVNGQRRIGIQAERAIEAGEELTLSYGKEYWEGKPVDVGLGIAEDDEDDD